jgi:hypothetical protein
MTKLRTALILLLAPVVPALGAVVTWDGGEGDWSVPVNWGGSIPSSGDEVRIYESGAIVNINTDAQASIIKFTDEATDNVTVNLQSGSLTESGATFSGRFVEDSTTTVNVNGGVWSGSGSIYGPTTGSATFNVTGGSLVGYNRFRYAGTSVNVSGGILDMGDQTTAESLSFADNASLSLTNSGVMVFDVFGNENINNPELRDDSLTDNLLGSNVDLTGGWIQVRFSPDYEPQVGDSFDLLGTGFSVNSSGSNILSTDFNNQYNILWDVSNWGTTTGASKGQLIIDGITPINPVPEPSTYALLSLGCVLVLLQLRRRARR